MKLRHVIVLFLLALASRESMSATDSISVTVDTLCDGFRVCVADERYDAGIYMVRFADSENQNAMFDPSDHPNKYGIISYFNYVKSACFYVKRVNYDKKLDAKIVVYHKGSHTTSILLELDSLYFQFFPSPKSVSNLGVITTTSSFGKVIQIGLPFEFNRSVEIKSINTKAQHFLNISGKEVVLPYIIPRGGIINITVAFNPLKERYFNDTIIIESDCFRVYFPIHVETNPAVITTNDIDFGELTLGESVCIDSGFIYNIGGESFNVSGWSINSDITLMSNAFHELLFYGNDILWPSTARKYHLCYTPTKLGTDSATILWSHTITSQIRDERWKGFTKLRGRCIMPKISWGKHTAVLLADSMGTLPLNVNLECNESFPVQVNQVKIEGVDSSEFEIINALVSLSNFLMKPSESNWFTIAFKPDMTKPLAERYADRHATLVAELADSNVTMELIGTFNPLHVKRELAVENLSFSPNPVHGQDAKLSFALAEPKQLAISIYDILGREVISIPSQYYSSGSFSNIIATSKLGDGSYILRVSDGSSTKSIGFRVVK